VGLDVRLGKRLRREEIYANILSPLYSRNATL